MDDSPPAAMRALPDGGDYDLLDAIRRAAWRLASLAVALIGVSLAVAAACAPVIREDVVGPIPVTIADVVEGLVPAGRLVEIDAETIDVLSVLRTRYLPWARAEDRAVTPGEKLAEYVQMRRAHDVVLTLRPRDAAYLRQTGRLRWPQGEEADLLNSMRDQAAPVDPRQRVASKLLDATQGANGGGWVVLAVSVLLLLSGVVALRRALPLVGNPRSSRELVRAVGDGSVDELLAVADSELGSSAAGYRNGLRIAPTVVVHEGVFRVQLMRTADVVWAFASRHVVRIKGIPVWITHSVVAVASDGSRLVVGMSISSALSAVAAIEIQAPWIVAVYDSDLEDRLRREPTPTLAELRARRLAWIDDVDGAFTSGP